MKLATNLLKFVVFIDVYVSIHMFLTFLVKNSYIFYCLTFGSMFRLQS